MRHKIKLYKIFFNVWEHDNVRICIVNNINDVYTPTVVYRCIYLW